jgi:hypothetical protein
MTRNPLAVLAIGLLACGSSASPSVDSGNKIPVDAGTDSRSDVSPDLAGADRRATDAPAVDAGGADIGIDRGAADGAADLRADAAPDGIAEAGPGTPDRSVDACFAGLRTGMGAFQDATRASADGAYRMRLALETASAGGTSGTYPWRPFALALATPAGSVCVTEAAGLAGSYRISHHNCADQLTVTAGGRRYVIANPDSAISLVDPSQYRRPATLTVFEGAAMVAGPVVLATVACNRTSFPGGRCTSGGPCGSTPE